MIKKTAFTTAILSLFVLFSCSTNSDHESVPQKANLSGTAMSKTGINPELEKFAGEIVENIAKTEIHPDLIRKNKSKLQVGIANLPKDEMNGQKNLIKWKDYESLLEKYYGIPTKQSEGFIQIKKKYVNLLQNTSKKELSMALKIEIKKPKYDTPEYHTDGIISGIIDLFGGGTENMPCGNRLLVRMGDLCIDGAGVIIGLPSIGGTIIAGGAAAVDYGFFMEDVIDCA